MSKDRIYNQEYFLEYTNSGGSCFYCGDVVPFKRITRDHLFPKNNNFIFKNNTIYACSWCNNLKSNLTIYQFRELLSHVFVFFCKKEQYTIANKSLMALKKCTNIINDKNSILYTKKYKFTRLRPGSAYEYFPKQSDIIKRRPLKISLNPLSKRTELKLYNMYYHENIKYGQRKRH